MAEKPEAVGQEVLFEVANHIATVRLNRPHRRNAINGAVTRAMSWIIRTVDEDPGIRAVVLGSSTPGMFCAGADLAEIAQGSGADLLDEHGGFGGLVKARRTKPWIAAVDGPALGGGCEFALACDMIVVSRSACLGLPEVKRGLFALAGGAFRLPRALPPALAIEALVTGEPVSAETAFAHGLANRLVNEGEATDAALSLAATIVRNAPVAVRESLAVARLACATGEEQLWDASNAAMLKVMSSKDAIEGPRAFMEKREPKWTEG